MQHIKIARKWRQYFYRYLWSYMPRRYRPSDVALSVLIPLAVKDLENVKLAIDSIRINLMHPIDQIVVVGQNDQRIQTWCENENLVYLNEEDILPTEILNLNFKINGKNNNGWIRQQIIKLSAFQFMQADIILVHDADTIFVRPISFFDKQHRQILFTSDEYIKNYHIMTDLLIGPLKRYRRSFIAHGMVFQRDWMESLQQKIATYCKTSWISAILNRIEGFPDASLSEYELYGNYIVNEYNDHITIKYWYNYQIMTKSLLNIDMIREKYRRFNSVSHHIRPNHVKRRKRFFNRGS